LGSELKRQTEILVGQINHEARGPVALKHLGRIGRPEMSLTSNSAHHHLARHLGVEARALGQDQRL
jgi:hypothetical protein